MGWVSVPPHCAHCKLTRYYFERQAEFDTINHCWGRDVADLINHRQSLKHSSKYAVAFQHEPTYITYKLTVIALITKGRINNRSKCSLLFWLKMKYDKKKMTHSGWLKKKIITQRWKLMQQSPLFFYPAHSSSLSKSGAYITHNATHPPTDLSDSASIERLRPSPWGGPHGTLFYFLFFFFLNMYGCKWFWKRNK